MTRFKAAWKAFCVVWDNYSTDYEFFCMLSRKDTEPLITSGTPAMLSAIGLILSGTAHARRYPAKRGDRGFKMVEGGEG